MGWRLDLFLDMNNAPWMLTLIYGPMIWNERGQLSNIANSFIGPWLICWNLNFINSQIDKRGGGDAFASSLAGALGTFLKSDWLYWPWLKEICSHHRMVVVLQVSLTFERDSMYMGISNNDLQLFCSWKLLWHINQLLHQITNQS